MPDEKLKDFKGIELDALMNSTDPDMPGMLARVMKKIDQPGVSISGYNGASGPEDTIPTITEVALPDSA